MNRFLFSSALLLVAFAAACAEAPTTPMMSEGPLFARPGSGDGETTNTRFSFSFNDDLSIRSDSKVSTNPQYEDDRCGVHAEKGADTDAVLDPDKNYKKSMGDCGPRQIHFVLNGSTVRDGSYITVRNVLGIADSDRTGIAFVTSASATGCNSIRFGINPNGTINKATGVQVTKTSGSNQWTVATDVNSVAECWTSEGNTVQITPIGGDGKLPFHLTLAQIP